MQRIGNLFDHFCSFENLLLAYRKAKKGSRKNGELGSFSFHLENELLALQSELKDLTYQPRPYRYFHVKDPKQRLISVASFRDRVVHHALVNLLEPIYEKIFIYDSYATRKGKGTHKAISRAQTFLRKNKWFFKADVEKFFDSIDQKILLSILERKIKDKKLLLIAEKIIRNGGKDGRGLPIGNLTSQFFANVYLNPFDYFVKETLKIKYYLRYMDDFVIFSPQKEVIKEIKIEVKHFLKTALNLTLKETASYTNQDLNGLSFLGRRIFPSIIRIKHENLQRVLRKMKRKEKDYKQKFIKEDIFLASMNSYWAYLSCYDTFELKKCILRQKGAS